MVENASVTRPDEMRVLLGEVARDLVRLGIENGEGVLALPQVYPGGGAVVVRVRRLEDRFFVTDAGMGFLEAELLGGSAFFARLAPGIAEQNGVRFDGYTMFATEVERDWLANAVVFIGTASRAAVERTAEKMSEEREISLRHALQERVQEAFAGRSSLNVEVRGRSSREWHFPAQVLFDDRVALFDLVTPHPNSVAAAFIKFRDIADLETRIDGVAVASKPLDPADQILISKAAHSLILLGDDRDVFLRAA